MAARAAQSEPAASPLASARSTRRTTLPALPLAARWAYDISAGLAQQFNYNSLGFRLVPQAIVAQIIVGLAAPILAGLAPILSGARVTVHRAITSRYQVTVEGFVPWLISAIILSAASAFPVWNAARLIIRIVLAYE